MNFVNAGSHPHTIHFHGIHPTNMDGVFEVVEPGGRFTYEFEAQPAGFHLYHCHATPLKKHIHKGLYGSFIIDPKEPRPPAQELVMVMNGFDTDADGGNNFYTVNGRSFYYAKYPIRVKRSELVRIYLANLTEFDLDQLVPPARRLLPLPADGHGRQLGVHGHGDAVPGPARRARDRVREHRARSCSTRTSRSSPSSAGWASSRSWSRWKRSPATPRESRLNWRIWAVVPVLLLALAVGVVVTSGSSLVDLVGHESAARRRVRHPPRGVLAG